MFNPAEFLDLAKIVRSQASDEKFARTCVGRAYYAAHLSARERVKPLFPDAFRGRPASDEHEIVREKLVELERGDIKNKLFDLAKKRARADYDLCKYPTESEQLHEADKAIELCESILSLLTGVP
jgi:hypothetical protein